MIDLDKIMTMAIIGDRHTGKTNLAFSFLKDYVGTKTKVTYAYPVDIDGFINIHSLQQLSQLTNCIIIMDELQKHIKFYEKSSNDTLLEVLSTIAHNQNVLIFTTPLSQFITKALDGFIDVFAYTEMKDLGTLKNGSKAKRYLQNNSFQQINKWSLNLKIGEALVISDSIKEFMKFEDQEIGKDWMSL